MGRLVARFALRRDRIGVWTVWLECKKSKVLPRFPGLPAPSPTRDRTLLRIRITTVHSVHGSSSMSLYLLAELYALATTLQREVRHASRFRRALASWACRLNYATAYAGYLLRT